MGTIDITNARLQALNYDYCVTKGYSNSNKNMKAVAYMLDTEAWSGFAGNTADYAIGGPTIEMLLKSYSQKYKVDYRAEAKSSKGYQISLNGGKSWSNYATGGTLSSSNNPYIISSNDKAWGYYLASPSNSYSDCGFTIDSSGGISCNSYEFNSPDYGFRPIVCLKENTELTKKAEGIYEIKENN